MKIKKLKQCWRCNNLKWKGRDSGSWAFCSKQNDWFKKDWDLGKDNKCEHFE